MLVSLFDVGDFGLDHTGQFRYLRERLAQRGYFVLFDTAQDRAAQRSVPRFLQPCLGAMRGVPRGRSPAARDAQRSCVFFFNILFLDMTEVI